MLWTASQIKRHDGGPVLFRQTRVGRDGAYFTCLKFRSMVVDAERVLADLHEQGRLRAGPVQDAAGPAHHQARAGGSAATRSTSSRS